MSLSKMPREPLLPRAGEVSRIAAHTVHGVRSMRKLPRELAIVRPVHLAHAASS